MRLRILGTFEEYHNFPAREGLARTSKTRAVAERERTEQQLGLLVGSPERFAEQALLQPIT
jgi:hypothetical protein